MRFLAIMSVFAIVACVGMAQENEPQLTPKVLKDALDRKPTGAEADKLAERVRKWFGNAITRGAPPKIADLTAAWAVEAPDLTSPPSVAVVGSKQQFPLTRIGSSNVYATVVTYDSGTAFRAAYLVGDRILPPEAPRRPTGVEMEVYTMPPETVRGADVPAGKVTQMPKWQSKIFDGTARDWWIYVPAQYKPEQPACVFVFQDGGGYKDFVPPVLDNLIHKGEMPVTVGVFVNPGVFQGGRSNRSFEYDTLSDQYARFLLEEILPEVEKTVKLRHDANSRAIGGISSGGICAFTVAWEKPEQFSKVLSWVGSFTNIASGPTKKEGGHNYEAMIRKTPKKPIRVYLQDGANDLDNDNGNWPLANLQMDKSLAWAGYDHKFVFGQGFHSNKHGRALLPESLRWLWRDYKPGE